jgi:rhodanese-related sulfurtransferase
MKLSHVSTVICLLLVTVFLYGCTIQTDSPNQIFEDVGVQEAFELIQDNQGNQSFVIIDIRTWAEFNEGHIENAVNIDFYSETFKEDLDKLDKNKIYFIYCRSGNRSGRAMPIMKELGFKEVYNLSVGIKKWIAEGLPVVKQISGSGGIRTNDLRNVRVISFFNKQGQLSDLIYPDLMIYVWLPLGEWLELLAYFHELPLTF